MSSLHAINIEQLLASHPPRTNFNLFWVDGAYTLRVAKVEGAFPWHAHPDFDEGWLVLRGAIQMRSEAGDVELRTGDAMNVPKGLRHSPLALEDGTTVAIVNARGFTNVYSDPEMSDQHAGYREHELEVQGQ